MEVLLAVNAQLIPRRPTDPAVPKTPVLDHGEACIEYEWKVDCTPTVVLKKDGYVSRETVEKIEKIQGELHPDMAIRPPGTEEDDGKWAGWVHFFIFDNDQVVRRILELVDHGDRSFEAVANIMYLNEKITVNGLHTDRSDLSDDCHLETMNGCPRYISGTEILKLLCPDLVKEDSFKVTIVMEFS